MWLKHWLKVEPVHISNIYTFEQPVSLDITLDKRIRKRKKET